MALNIISKLAQNTNSVTAYQKNYSQWHNIIFFIHWTNLVRYETVIFHWHWVTEYVRKFGLVEVFGRTTLLAKDTLQSDSAQFIWSYFSISTYYDNTYDCIVPHLASNEIAIKYLITRITSIKHQLNRVYTLAKTFLFLILYRTKIREKSHFITLVSLALFQLPNTFTFSLLSWITRAL